MARQYIDGENLRIRIAQMKRLVRYLHHLGYGAVILQKPNRTWGTDWGIESSCPQEEFDRLAKEFGLHVAPHYDADYRSENG